MNLMKVGYYHHPLGAGNFGDELAPVVAEAMLGQKVETQPLNTEPFLATIGSVCHHLYAGSHIWGSGIMMYQLHTADLTVHAVRGPRTESFLRGIIPDMPESIPWGDPALLLPDFYQPEIRPELSNKIGFVPHWSYWDEYEPLAEELEIFYDIHLIDPTANWTEVVNEIASCDRIISSSLHGLILADAYDRPNLWLRQDLQYHIADLKFQDYFESIQRRFHYQTDLETAATIPIPQFWSQGAQALDLTPLRNSFPHHLFTKEE